MFCITSKTFERDKVSILNVQKEKQKLCDKLLECINGPTDDGWEQLFLKNIELKSDGKYFFGHKLLENVGRSNKSNKNGTKEYSQKRNNKRKTKNIRKSLSFKNQKN